MNSIASFFERTFLIERATGVFIYFTVILLTYVQLRQSSSSIKFKRTLNICLLILCVMAYFYIPPQSADLYRIRMRIEAIRSWPVDYVRLFISRNSSPGAYILYYLMAKINNEGVLPVIACLTFFSNIFHILKKEKELERSSARSLAIAFLYLMAQGLFLGVISGIRSGIGFSIVARVIYDDFVLGKKTIVNYLLCFIALSFHIAIAPIVGVYMVFSVYDNWKNRNALMTFLTTVSSIAIIAWVFISRSDFINVLLDKAESYTSGTTYSNRWEFIIVGMSIIVLAKVLLQYRKQEQERELRTVYFLVCIMMVGVIVMFRNYTIFHRYGNFMMYLSLPLIAKSIDNDQMIGKGRLFNLVKYGSYIVLLLACVRGDLCGYKFFLLQ